MPLCYKSIIEQSINPKWISEKVSEETSYLIWLTAKVCANCISGECDITRFWISWVTCMNNKSRLSWLLNSKPTATCWYYN